MKFPALVAIAALAATPSIFLFAQGAGTGAADPLAAEQRIVANAHSAALLGNDAQVDAELSLAQGIYASAAPTVALSRRAAAVCGWLQNDNQYGLAMKLARRVVATFGTTAEPVDADREERLYWEAWLEGRVLDDKSSAVSLLQAAEKLAPKDARVTELELEFVSAIRAFGR
jgi:hypothetical protein